MPGFLGVEVLVRRLRVALLLWASLVSFSLLSYAQQVAPSGHYLFAWTGDLEGKGNDFLAVIDADPASPTYGKLMTTVVTDQQPD